jgi:cytochrome b6-f complex subunit 5
MIEPVLLGMVLGFSVATIGGLFVAAWIQYKRGNPFTNED